MPEDPLLKTDIKVTQRIFDQEVSDRERVDFLITPSGDLATVSHRENLVQAILNRLLTRKGELAQLGHPEYGSRLHTLIGELNNTRTQGFAALYIRECLIQEPRVRQIKQITFALSSRGIDRNQMEITIIVRPIGDPDDLPFTLSLNLGG